MLYAEVPCLQYEATFGSSSESSSSEASSSSESSTSTTSSSSESSGTFEFDDEDFDEIDRVRSRGSRITQPEQRPFRNLGSTGCAAAILISSTGQGG